MSNCNTCHYHQRNGNCRNFNSIFEGDHMYGFQSCTAYVRHNPQRAAAGRRNERAAAAAEVVVVERPVYVTRTRTVHHTSSDDAALGMILGTAAGLALGSLASTPSPRRKNRNRR